MNTFDQRFGKAFLATVPHCPGVYKIFNDKVEFIYVGKSKNLYRRLSQYRNAKRRKKHAKMLQVIREASRIEFELCENELEAELLESRLIQDFRPKWNIAGAFFFLYPVVGLRKKNDEIHFCFTTQPQFFEGYFFHGAYRSRQITGDAFFALMHLLRYIGHSIPIKKKRCERGLPKYSYFYGFRQIPPEWDCLWDDFWAGKSNSILEEIIMALVENAAAREKRIDVQRDLNLIKKFWIHEASLLFRARELIQYKSYPVSQKDRDVLFLKYRHHCKSKAALEVIGSPQSLIQGG